MVTIELENVVYIFRIKGDNQENCVGLPIIRSRMDAVVTAINVKSSVNSLQKISIEPGMNPFKCYTIILLLVMVN